MKSFKFTAYVLALSLSFVLQSCSEDEEVYSCNQEINNWVKENKDYIQTLTRSQWVEFDHNVAQAAYIAFTPSQKVEFWKEKIEEVKSLDWSEDELAHIQKAEDFIMANTQYFRNEKLSEEELDDIETFFVKWMKSAEKEFGWTQQTSTAIICTGFKMADKDGNVILPQSNKRAMSTPAMTMAKESTCNCNKSSLVSCIGDPFGSCEAAKCEETNNGCGIIWVQSCNGRCGGVTI